jgi:hypothetical protein
MAPRKPAPKKTGRKMTTYKKKSIPRAPRNFDGTTILVSTYFEVIRKQSANGASTNVAYTIKCDPRNATLHIGENPVALNAEGLSIQNGSNGLLLNAGAVQTGDLVFTRFGDFGKLYGQYKINSVNLSVDVDRECGLDNPVCFRSDKQISTPISDMANVKASAHKQYTMTETKRTAKYGWKPTDSQDKEFRNMSQTLNDNEAHFLKVFQEIEPKENGKCKHQVTVTMSVTLKDSRSTNVALN